MHHSSGTGCSGRGRFIVFGVTDMLVLISSFLLFMFNIAAMCYILLCYVLSSKSDCPSSHHLVWRLAAYSARIFEGSMTESIERV